MFVHTYACMYLLLVHIQLFLTSCIAISIYLASYILTCVVSFTETVNARKVFNEYNPKLVRLLPLKDPYFVASLTQQNLFSGVLKEKVMRASTRADASACFLYETIECSLDVDDVEPFNKLLIVMENFENLTLIKLAREIKQKMTQNNRTEG